MGTQLPFGGGCGGRGRRVKRAPLCQPPSQPFAKGCPPLAPPSRWTTRPGVPGLVWQLCPSWVRASLPPEEASRAISGLPRPASKSQQDAVFFGILPSTALAETPSSQGYVIDASKVPSLENLPATRGCSRCLLALSKPEGISSMSWVPWEEPRVPVLPGCPHHSPAGHSSGDNRVPAKWGGQK